MWNGKSWKENQERKIGQRKNQAYLYLIGIWLDARLHRLATVWTPQHHHRLKSIKLSLPCYPGLSDSHSQACLHTWLTYVCNVHCAWRSFKMLLYKSGYTGRNFVRGMLKRGTSCKCSLYLPQRTRANKESQATFEEQQTLEWKSSAIIILQMKTHGVSLISQGFLRCLQKFHQVVYDVTDI